MKVSGEALAGEARRGLDFSIINNLCRSIQECVQMGVQIGLVIGAGNFWRGVKDGADKMQRSHADAMGMLGTVMNAIAVADALEKHGIDARVLSAVEMNKFTEYYTRDVAERYLREGKVVLFAAGTGNPYFSTDTGAVLRGVEIEADAILMAKNVDAIYSADPAKDQCSSLHPVDLQRGPGPQPESHRHYRYGPGYGQQHDHGMLWLGRRKQYCTCDPWRSHRYYRSE